jgi:flagellar basal body-associated protein FliL
MMSDEQQHKNGRTAKWIAIISTIVSLVVGIVFAAYVLGQRTGKVLDIAEWKAETAPRIERMDAVGTNSFKFFHDEYLRTQARQEAKIAELEKMIYDKQLEDLKSRLTTLERKP